MASSREKILQRLKAAADKRKAADLEIPDLEAPIYVESGKSLDESFCENLELISGIVYKTGNLNSAIDVIKQLSEEEKWDGIFCLDKQLRDAMEGKITFSSSPDKFESLKVGITPCEFLIAHLGSVLVSSGGASGRRLHVFPETHVVIAHSGQLVRYLDDALKLLHTKYGGNLPSMVTNITGPSRTADIEKTLVKGMHGPRKLIVILCADTF